MNPTLKELLIFGRSMREFIQHSFVLQASVGRPCNLDNSDYNWNNIWYNQCPQCQKLSLILVAVCFKDDS